jgi:hypothetical protein
MGIIGIDFDINLRSIPIYSIHIGTWVNMGI